MPADGTRSVPATFAPSFSSSLPPRPAALAALAALAASAGRRKGGAADEPGDRAAPHALGAHAHPGIGAVGRGDADALQIGLELTAADARHLGPHTAQVFGAAARADLIAHLNLLAADFTRPSHDNDPWRTQCNLPPDGDEAFKYIDGGRQGNPDRPGGVGQFELFSPPGKIVVHEVQRDRAPFRRSMRSYPTTLEATMRRSFRFSIRDLFRLTLMVALALGWFVRERQLEAEVDRAKAWRSRAGALEHYLKEEGCEVIWDLELPGVSLIWSPPMARSRASAYLPTDFFEPSDD